MALNKGKLQLFKRSSINIWSKDELKNEWNEFSKTYRVSDATMQTFYYSLVNMLDLGNAKNILEVGCGTGKLVPYALSLKNKDTTYLATDLCPNMISYFKETIEGFIEKMNIKEDREQWLSKQKCSYKIANCQYPIQAPYKFDRIIANLVLQGSSEPEKMMKNFYDMAQEGGLLGVTVWGKEEDNNLFNLIPEALLSKGVNNPERHTSFKCLDKLKQLGEESGWELITEWYQTAPLLYKADENLKSFLKFTARGDQLIANYMFRKASEILESKKALIFASQLAIFRKKSPQL